MQILKELFTEKVRMVLTILAIAWGTFAITSMLAIGQGLRVDFVQAVANSGKNLLTVEAGATSQPYKGLAANTALHLTKQDLNNIQHGVNNIIAISPVYNAGDTIRYQDKSSHTNILAVNPNYSSIHEIATQPNGRFISPFDTNNQSAVIVLGLQTAKELFPNIDPVGKFVTINNQPFKVIGVMQAKAQIAATQAPDKFNNWIPAATYKVFANPTAIDSFSLTYKDVTQLAETKQQIRKIIAMHYNVNPNDKNIVTLTDLASRQQKIDHFFLGMQIFLGIVGALTLLVAGVGIANVMFASVSQATHNIGIRMTVGAKTYQILFYYLFEALLATAIGGIVGFIMSWFLVYGISHIPMHGKLIEAIGKPIPILSLSVVLTVIIVLGIIGLLAGFFPALKAARIDPAEALRYE